MAAILVGVVSAIVFISWFYRAYRNLYRAGAPGVRHGPGWAIGSWFIPVFNYIRPKQLANEIWRGTTYPDLSPDWQGRPVAPIVNWWWGFWVAGGVVGLVGRELVIKANAGTISGATVHDTLVHERTGFYGYQVGLAISIVAAVLAIIVVRRITAAGVPPTAGSAPPPYT